MISFVKSNTEDARVLVRREVTQMPKWENAVSYSKMSNR